MSANMNKLSIATLEKQPIVVHTDSSVLFETYHNLIRPQIIASDNLLIHQKMSLAKISLFIKNDGQTQLVNNFEVFYLLKTPDIEHALLSETISIVYIDVNQFCIKVIFYELIDIIAKYQKILDIEAIYKNLDNFLNPELNQRLFDKNIFSISTFCRLIGIHEQTYYKRCKKEESDVKK